MNVRPLLLNNITPIQRITVAICSPD